MKILFVDSCIRKESRTRELAEYVLSASDFRLSRKEFVQLSLYALAARNGFYYLICNHNTEGRFWYNRSADSECWATESS